MQNKLHSLQIIPDVSKGVVDLNFIKERIAEIGFDALKDKIKDTLKEAAARKKLNDFLQKQEKVNFYCTKEEEVDFQALADYIRGDLIEDVKLRLFGDKIERGIAHKNVIGKALSFSKSKTGLSEQRVKKMISDSLCILRKFYEIKANRDLLYLAGRIEDTIIDEIFKQNAQLSKQIEEVKKLSESNSLLSVEYNMQLAESGQIAEVGKRLSKNLKAISAIHPLYPYYGYSLKNHNGDMVSIPLSKDAVNKYPPKLNIIADEISIGSHQNISDLHTDDIFDYSYHHQLPITLSICAATKLLGKIPDPNQNEARDMQGKKIKIVPPKFPEAFPCSISLNGETVFDYLLMRTKEILEDGTAIVTNEEQVQRTFDVVFLVDRDNKKLQLNITPRASASKVELMKYVKFLDTSSKGGTVAIKALALDTLLVSGKGNSVTPSETALSAKIEFLEKVIVVENYFDKNLIIPKEISVEEHQILNRLYDIVHFGSFSGQWSELKVVYEISGDFKEKINELKDSPYMFAYTWEENIELFSQELSFPIKRVLHVAKFKDLMRIKEKTKILDIGDTITIYIIPDETVGKNTFSDSFFTDNEM